MRMEMPNNQFGFRCGLGSRKPLFSVTVLSQTYLDVNKDLHICFIDYYEAFD